MTGPDKYPFVGIVSAIIVFFGMMALAIGIFGVGVSLVRDAGTIFVVYSLAVVVTGMFTIACGEMLSLLRHMAINTAYIRAELDSALPEFSATHPKE